MLIKVIRPCQNLLPHNTENVICYSALKKSSDMYFLHFLCIRINLVHADSHYFLSVFLPILGLAGNGRAYIITGNYEHSYSSGIHLHNTGYLKKRLYSKQENDVYNLW